MMIREGQKIAPCPECGNVNGGDMARYLMQKERYAKFLCANCGYYYSAIGKTFILNPSTRDEWIRNRKKKKFSGDEK